MKKALKIEVGTYLQIPLSDNSFAYGRVLEEPYMAFFNYQTDNPSTDMDIIDSKPILFKLAVRYRDQKRWDFIGNRALQGELKKPIVSFMQDLADFKKCVIFDSSGVEREATPEECIGLERAEVWDQHHIEQRLLDTFQGQTNAAELYARVRLK